MNLADICTREIVMADAKATLQQAASLMRQHHVGTLVVVTDAGEGMRAVGIVTDRDIVVEAVARGLDVTQAEVGRLAQDKLAAVPMHATVGEAISAMKKAGVRRLLVSGDGDSLHGIVSLDDLVGALAHEMSDLAQAVRSGIERETAERAPLPPPAARRPVTIPAYAPAFV